MTFWGLIACSLRKIFELSLGIVNKLTILKHWAAILQVWAVKFSVGDKMFLNSSNIYELFLSYYFSNSFSVLSLVMLRNRYRMMGSSTISGTISGTVSGTISGTISGIISGTVSGTVSWTIFGNFDVLLSRRAL